LQTTKQSEVQNALESPTLLTSAQLAAFHANDQDTFMRLDREPENAVGRKERTIGALRRYRQEHGLPA
jgi:hypothetical protein